MRRVSLKGAGAFPLECGRAGTLRDSECVESPPHPKPSLRFGFDLSPQAGRGKEAAPTSR